ncbi:MAG: 1,4-alpha-glucan branching protein GlgB [Bacillota bacterium]|nr:1,4-alpha-glucan branching protein GlgB [Bacillota bacterium]
MNYHNFYNGNEFDAYKFLGAHKSEKGFIFRVYAPNAQNVSLLIHDKEITMTDIYEHRFFETIIEEAEECDTYEYKIYTYEGWDCVHCDPYGFGMQMRPDHKSVLRNRNTYKFMDQQWKNRKNQHQSEPLNIYELHVGSWRKKEDGSWYNYQELADLLIPYLKENGYNYVEFMPLSEHPCDESWGYQTTGFFAPTSRYGTCNQLKYLVDQLHQNDIGAILDFVPVHFATDSYGLAKFDGYSLYEHEYEDIGVSEWGSYNFIHSKGEVQSFLASNANYWLEEYHFDGLRMDAISRMIYWMGDEYRGVNETALEFLKKMNNGLKQRHPNCILIAEDSTNYPNVTKPVWQGGLGFDYKWDMGWMHDTLEFFQLHPEERKRQYHKLTFSMVYFYNEQYLLPLSHDEVVHGKATIVQKMYGDYEQKFAQARSLFLYMMVHPGKKLNFMGNEIGQFREWDVKREQDWNLTTYPMHDSFHTFITDLNLIYQYHSALHNDYDPSSFRWLDCSQEHRCIYAFQRINKKDNLIAIFNLSQDVQKEYILNIEGNSIQILLDTDAYRYSGNSEFPNVHFENHQIRTTLNPFSSLLIKVIE